MEKVIESSESLFIESYDFAEVIDDKIKITNLVLRAVGPQNVSISCKEATLTYDITKEQFLKQKLSNDSELQHLKYFFEGYRERMLVELFGEQTAENLGVDTQKYSPGSARQFSYSEGMKKAEEDIISRVKINE